MLHVSEGLQLSHAAVNAAGEDFHVVTARLPRNARLEVRPAPSVTDFPSLLPPDAGPWVAVNGGFYDPDGLPMGLVLAGGVEHRPLARGGGSGVLEGGSAAVRIVHRDAWAPGATEAVQSIDRLVDEGKSLVHVRAGARRAARTAVAITEAEVVMVVAFDAEGSRITDKGARLIGSGVRGPSLGALATWLAEDLGAVQALNLDGAISTQLTLRDGAFTWSLEGEAGTVQAVVARP